MTGERYDGQHGIAERCPDGGTCHHYGCADGCFRVRHAEPLSGVFPADLWPSPVLREHGVDVPQKWAWRWDCEACDRLELILGVRFSVEEADPEYAEFQDRAAAVMHDVRMERERGRGP